jgi:MinD superfamily P-loop ATPase
VIQLGSNVAIFNGLCHSCYACSELCPANALPMQKYKIGEIKTIVNKKLILVEGRLDIGEEKAMPLIHQIHKQVDKKYMAIPIQIFDCPPGTSCPVVAACKDTDFVILVTEPTPFGLNDLKLAFETMRKLNKPIGVVINRHGIGNADVEKYCDQEHIQILAKIPYEQRIAEYYSQGKLVFDKIEFMGSILQNIFNTIEKQIRI